jgi:hypothetical protein
MKPGQPVEIHPDAKIDPSPVRGTVALVAGDEVVLELDKPRRGLFSARVPVGLSYRDEAGEQHVTARVVGMQGAERLIISMPAPGREAGDQRRHLRVEHLLRLEYQVLAPDEVDEVRAQVLGGPRILKYEWQPALPPAAAGAENEPVAPEWMETPEDERLARIERKLDLLLDRLGVEPLRTAERPFVNVSLSASGIRFRDFQRRLTAGDMVYVCFELPLSPTVEIAAIAETLYIVEPVRQTNLSAGRDVVLDFRVIKDDSRELVERYCQSHLAIRRSA